jgi:hypothetical protein
MVRLGADPVRAPPRAAAPAHRSVEPVQLDARPESLLPALPLAALALALRR